MSDPAPDPEVVVGDVEDVVKPVLKGQVPAKRRPGGKRPPEEREPGNGVWKPFDSETARAAAKKSQEIQKMRKAMFREGYNAAMADAGALIANMQRQELERIARLEPGHPDRIKVLQSLGEKTLDRLMGKPSTSVEVDGEVGIADKIARLAEAD